MSAKTLNISVIHKTVASYCQKCKYLQYHLHKFSCRDCKTIHQICDECIDDMNGLECPCNK